MSDMTQDRLAQIAQRAGDATYLGGETQEVADDALAMHAALAAVLALADRPTRFVRRSTTECDEGRVKWVNVHDLHAAINDALGGE